MTKLVALKQCTGCNKPLPIDRFRMVKGKPIPRCRQCISTYQKERRANVGETRTGTHRTWDTMKQRCNNPKHRAYKDYGGRGITVCAAWLKFENFLADMGERPPGKTIDRVNNNDGYHKENCRWSTTHEQAANRRMSKTNKSGVQGVWYSRSTKRWQVQVMVEGVRHHLYQGPSKKLALQARKDFDANQVERSKARDSGVCHYCRRPFAEYDHHSLVQAMAAHRTTHAPSQPAKADCRYCGGGGRFQIVSPVSDHAWADCFCTKAAPSQPTAGDDCDAMRYDFDGFGYKYIDSGSGSDWQTRYPDAEPLFAAAMPAPSKLPEESAFTPMGVASGWDGNVE